MTYLVGRLERLPGESRREAEQRVARGLLERLGCEGDVEHAPNGAPYMSESPELHISISHCREAVAVAVSEDRNVGIDIECRRRVSMSLAERVCSAEELVEITTSDDAEMAFLRMWTRREAVLKCRRTGIQGFGSLIDAGRADDCEVCDIECGMPDVVAAIAWKNEEREWRK